MRVVFSIVMIAFASITASAQTCPAPEPASLWAWGTGIDGQLGDGLALDSVAPTISVVPNIATSVSGGATHTLAVDCAGDVWASGGNFFGELGTADGAPRSVPEQLPNLTGVQTVDATNYHSLAY